MTAEGRKLHFSLLDALRGLASLAVVWCHCCGQIRAIGQRTQLGISEFQQDLLSALLKLDLGVPFFFTISAICISASVESRATAGGGIANFARARLRRIFPPFWIALGLWVLVLLLTPADLVSSAPVTGDTLSGLSSMGWFANVFLIERIVNAEHGTAIPCILGVSWSLSYEIQFYVVMGIYLISKRCFWAVLALMSVVCTGSYVRDYFGASPIGYGFLVDGIGLYFLLGICCYQTVMQRSLPGFWQGLSYTITFLATLGVIVRPSGAVGYLAMVAISTQFITRKLRADAAVSTGFLRTRSLQRLGEMSYSLYLVHPLVCVLAPNVLVTFGIRDFWLLLGGTLSLATAGSLALAYLFYLAIERRFISSKLENRGFVA